MLKFVKRTAIILIVLTGIILAGPRPKEPVYALRIPVVPQDAQELENFIAASERRHSLKPDNEARIVWADTTRRKTKFAFVYLHGFSASQKEGDPVHRRIARAFGANLYLARIADHGVDTTDALFNFTAERAWKSAREALAIGEAIGEKVILISTSTGGTLALMLASHYPDRVDALVNMSPNIEINNPAAFLLNDPWGLYIARAVMGGKYRITGGGEAKQRYWNTKYRLEATVQLQELLETTMTDETFARIRQPSLTLYYYKNEEEQDPEVRVSAMLSMHRMLSTPDDLKKAVALPEARAHVIGSSLASADVEGVYAEIEDFLRDVLSGQSMRQEQTVQVEKADQESPK